MSPDSLWLLCLILFFDGATIAAFSTAALLYYGRYHDPWLVASLGGLSSAIGSAIQLLLLRWVLRSDRPWLQWFAPSRDKIKAAVTSYPSASFMLLAVARATPMPDLPLKIVAAITRYPILLYGVATLLGSLPYYFVLAMIGHHFKIPLWALFALIGAVGLATLVDWLRKRFRRARA